MRWRPASSCRSCWRSRNWPPPFSSYAEAGIGRWAGFTIGWLYWVMLIMVSGLEVTGAATFFVGWFPAVPQWVVALVIVVVIGGINLLAAGQYG